MFIAWLNRATIVRVVKILLSIVLVILCIVVVIAVRLNWTFVERAWNLSVSSMGTTTLAVVVTILSVAIVFYRKHRTWTAMRTHLAAKLKYGPIVPVVYGLIFLYQLSWTVPKNITKQYERNLNTMAPYKTPLNPPPIAFEKGRQVRQPTSPTAPKTADQSLGLSLRQLSPDASVMFLEEPLKSDQFFYRFRLTNRASDIYDLMIALDLPALLDRNPILIDHSGAENLTVKAAFSGYVKMNRENKMERVSTKSNGVIIETSRLKRDALIDVGVITTSIKIRQITIVTAPDGSIQLATEPAYGRYGSVSVIQHNPTGSKHDVGDMGSFPIIYPFPNTELIDGTKLRTWSRSILIPLTQDEMLEAIKNGTTFRIEQHYQ